jgi:hypothetical protein
MINTLLGAHLTLLIGPAVPVIAPKIVMDALTSVQVTRSRERNGFQMSFTVGKTSPLTNIMLPAGYFDPIVTRAIIIVTLNGIPNVLMDGFVTNQEFSPSNEPGKSTLTITGEDVSLAMDLIQNIVPMPAMPDVAKVNLTLAPYSLLGIIPLVIPPFVTVVQSPTQQIESQNQVTAREYLKSLARRNGYVFVIEPGPLPGQNIAYFGPDINLPIPQSALSVNFDAHTNVENLSFSLDGKAKKIKVYTIYDPFTNRVPIPIPVPNISAFKPPTGLRPTMPAKIEFANDGAYMKPDVAAREILSFLMNESNTAISANGSVDVMRYKKILRPRMLVGVRGASITYDGFYYVDSVTHNIKKGEYKQSFTLSRDGLISNTPIVPAF